MNDLLTRYRVMGPVLALGAVAALMVLMISQSSCISPVSGGAFVAVAVACGWFAAQRYYSAAIRQARAELEAARAVASEDIWRRILPIWSRQVESARSQTEQAISDLAQRFSGLSQQLETAVAASRNEAGDSAGKGQGGAVAVIAESEADLGAVTGSFKVLLESRKTTLDEVRGLSAWMRELSKMTEEVSAISAQTNVLAINAAIQAAHAGEAGRGFAVVAAEVRRLAKQSGETAKDMSDKVKAINSAIEGVSVISEKSAQTDDLTIGSAESVIRRVLDRFNEIMSRLTESAGVLQQASTGIGHEIGEVLVSLQFQDRTSQILTQVRDHLDELSGRLREGGLSEADGVQPMEAQAWLAEMEQGYTTQEQRANHRGLRTAAAAGAGVTFF